MPKALAIRNRALRAKAVMPAYAGGIIAPSTQVDDQRLRSTGANSIRQFESNIVVSDCETQPGGAEYTE